MNKTETATTDTDENKRTKPDRRKSDNKIVKTLFKSYGFQEERTGIDRRAKKGAAASR